MFTAMSTKHRRSFLKAAGLGAAAAVVIPQSCLLAMAPLKRPGKPRLALSLAAYSFRNFFNKPDPSGRSLDMFGFVDYCADQGLEGAEVTSYYFPKSPSDEYLLKLKRHAFLRGIALSGTAVGNNFALPKGDALTKQIEDTKKWIDCAALMGAPHIRIFAGPVPKQISREEAKKNCIEAIEECCAYAGGKGVILGLENHGGIVDGVQEVLEIVKAVKSDWFGINLDSGNFHSEDPYADLAACAPYTVNAQLKAEIKRKGAAKAERSDIPRVMKMLRDANYQGYVALEYESAEDPWTAVPRLLKQMREAITA
jgi:sugar phosphate isomerase/epimerase